MRIIRQNQLVASETILVGKTWFEAHGSSMVRLFLRYQRAVRCWKRLDVFYLCQSTEFKDQFPMRRIRYFVEQFGRFSERGSGVLKKGSKRNSPSKIRLVINNLIEHRKGIQAFVRFIIDLKNKARDAGFLGVGVDFPKEVKEFLRLLLQATRRVRGCVISNRIALELLQAYRKRRYVFFETITVRAGEEEVLFPKSNDWKSFQRRWKIELKKAADAKGLDDAYHAYYCVPELGGRDQRLHYHILRITDQLPIGCSDPATFDGSYKREIDKVKEFWKFGFYQCIPVRWSDDAFSRLGWRWPVDKAGQVIKSSLVRVALYVTKYVTKRYKESPSSDNIIWKLRTKMSRGFGLAILDQELGKATLLELMSLVQIPINKEVFEVIPHLFLMRWRAKRHLVERQELKWERECKTLDASLAVLNSVPTLKDNVLEMILPQEEFRSVSSGMLIIPPVQADVFRSAYQKWIAVSEGWKHALESVGGQHNGVGSRLA